MTISANPDPIFTRESSETRKLGAEIGRRVVPGDVIGLFGELGSGKTVLVKGVAEGLGIEDPERRVVSPTFTLINEFDGRLPLYHFDLFRLKRPEEFLEIGGRECLYSEGVCVIEWADRFPEILPEHAMRIHLKVCGPSERRIILEGFPAEFLIAVIKEGG